MLAIEASTLRALAPHVSGKKAEKQSAIIEAVGAALRATLADYGIDTRLRIAHFLAQIAHESDGFCTTEEYASGAAYEGRADLGNTQPGDGRRFKGRGLIQLTGRANYKTFGQRMGLDLVNNPEIAAEPKTSLAIACEFWKDKKLNARADEDDLMTATRRINGGLNGLEARRAFLIKAKTVLAQLEGSAILAEAPANSEPVLRRGSRGEEVAKLQEMLRAKGFPVAIDSDYGAATELAVVQFQKVEKLEADGIVGPATWKRLSKK